MSSSDETKNGFPLILCFGGLFRNGMIRGRTLRPVHKGTVMQTGQSETCPDYGLYQNSRTHPAGRDLVRPTELRCTSTLNVGIYKSGELNKKSVCTSTYCRRWENLPGELLEAPDPFVASLSNHGRVYIRYFVRSALRQAQGERTFFACRLYYLEKCPKRQNAACTPDTTIRYMHVSLD